MSARWPLPTDLREPGFPDSYRVDTAGETDLAALSALTEIRQRVKAEAGRVPLPEWSTAAVLDVIDRYAREIIDQADDDVGPE